MANRLRPVSRHSVLRRMLEQPLAVVYWSYTTPPWALLLKCLPLSLFMSCVYLCPAVDLLDSILLLDPDTRMTAKEGLSHPYLSEFHDPESEPDSPPYDDSFESMELDVGEWSSE